MALGYNTLRAFPRMRTYADAVRREAETKPIRGRTPEVKPLGRRNQSYFNISREGDDICVNAGTTPVIRYRPNGDVLVYDQADWNKATFNDLIGGVAGIHIITKDGKAWAHVDGGLSMLRPNPRRQYNRETREWAMPKDTVVPENVFRLVEKYANSPGYLAWTYVNPPQRMVHNIRRKAMKEVQERYAAFTAYATAMESLRKDNPPNPSEYEEPFNVKFGTSALNNQTYYGWHSLGMPPAVTSNAFSHANANNLCNLMLSDDAETNYKAYLWLATQHYTHRGPIADRIKRVLIMNHYDDVLMRREASAGKATKDRYAWAVPVTR